MGSVHKINDEYYIEFYARGLLYQQKAGKDPGKAEELLRQIEEKIAKGELQTISREIELDIFFLNFLKYAQSRYHPHTFARLNSAIKHFSGFLKDNCPSVTKLSQVTPRVLEEYKALYAAPSRKSFNERKINLTILLLREMLEYGIKIGHINDNPTLHVRLLDVQCRRKITFDAGEWENFIKNVDAASRPVFILMRQTGLRPHEVLDLTWQQVDLNRNVIFVRSREVPLTPDALDLLKKMFVNIIDHKARVFGPSLTEYDLFERFKSSDLPQDASLAMLRHSFACELFVKRVPFLTIGKILGVHDIAKLMIYAPHIPTQRKDILP